MIKNLTVKNYILIDELSLDFNNGLNAITGETGAGKSIIINAIDLIFAQRVNKEIIKNGEEKAFLEVTLSSKESIKQILEDNGIDDFGDEIIISKEVTQSSVRSRVNGTLVNQEFLKILKENFLDIHSQHQTYAFMQPKYHIDLLDNYAKGSYGDILTNYQSKYSEYKELCTQLEKAKQSSNTTESQIDFLMFQINEIEEARISDIKEYEELKNELNVHENVEKLKELTGSAYWALRGDEGSIFEILGKIKSNISKASSMDENLIEIEENFITATESLNSIAAALRDYSQNLDNDTQRLNDIQERIFSLDKLRRKYGSTLEEVIKTYDGLKSDYEKIEFSTKNVDELENKIRIILKELNNIADKISGKRKEFATVLSSLIIDKLENLELPKSKFEIAVEPAELNNKGKDKIEFMISTNISESLKPLSKVASGGEISRVMLAIKSIFAQSDDIDTVVFDEIDTGISGKASQSVADELVELAKYHQIILITHQPIIASKATNYFYVTKSQDVSGTTVCVKTLDEGHRIEALAELASGEINEQSIEFARSLISQN